MSHGLDHVAKALQMATSFPSNQLGLNSRLHVVRIEDVRESAELNVWVSSSVAGRH